MKKQEDRINEANRSKRRRRFGNRSDSPSFKKRYSVIVLETDKPSAIRRLVAFSEAVEKLAVHV